MSKKILVVVDMQKDFIDGALGSAEAVKIVEGCKAKIEAAVAAGDTVIFTRDTHGEDYMNTEEGKNLPVVHCIKGTAGWEIESCLTKAAGNALILDKETFGSKELGHKVSEILAADKNIESVELCGLCTDICVISNALLIKAFNPNIPISVDATCSAGVTPDSHDTALKAMASCQIKVSGQGTEPWR
ncbi:MAG: cysteine hydrolase [Lachnospiraceae bacterium]|nr:cysteine hydrolase [Lachnospiraceae bacterium]